MIGRTESTLAQSKEAVQAISASTTCLVFNADVADDKAMCQIAAQVGSWDVFILNAGHLPKPGPVASADISDYWEAYEVHFFYIPKDR